MSEIVVRTEDGVVEIRLNRPDKKNAITQAMYAAMTEAAWTRRCSAFSRRWPK